MGKFKYILIIGLCVVTYFVFTEYREFKKFERNIMPIYDSTITRIEVAKKAGKLTNEKACGQLIESLNNVLDMKKTSIKYNARAKRPYNLLIKKFQNKLINEDCFQYELPKQDYSIEELMNGISGWKSLPQDTSEQKANDDLLGETSYYDNLVLRSERGDELSEQVLSLLSVSEQSREGLNDNQIIKTLKQESENGNAIAKTEMGMNYLFGTTYFGKDYEAAFEKFNEPEVLKSSSALYYLGLIYEYGLGQEKNLGLSFEYYTRSAEAGNSNAQVMLSRLYREGIVVTKSKKIANRYLHMAADNGNFSAMDILLFSYDMAKGERIPMAIAWFEKMAEKGHAGSMRELGNLYYAYYRGYEDKDKAEVWYRKGAHAGDSEAQYKMGMFFSKTLIEKKEWLEKAAHQGFEDAISRLKEYDRGRPDVVYANLIPVPSDDKANYHLLSLEESLTSKTIVVGRDANDSYNNVNFEIKCGSFEYRSPGDKNRYFTATKLSSDQNKLIMHDIIDFICNVRGSTDTSILLNVSADRKANYYLISKSSLKNGNLIVTSRREGPSGTGFSKREINCQDNSFRYLGDGSTLEEMNATYNVGQMRRAKKDDVYTGISHDVIQAVCE